MDFKIRNKRERYDSNDSRAQFRAAATTLGKVRYKDVTLDVDEINTYNLLFLINELNKENNQLKRDVEDLNLEMTLLKDEISEMKWQLDLD